LFHFRLPGTSVPGFHIPPLRGWNLGVPPPVFDAEFSNSLKPRKVGQPVLGCVGKTQGWASPRLDVTSASTGGKEQPSGAEARHVSGVWRHE